MPSFYSLIYPFVARFMLYFTVMLHVQNNLIRRTQYSCIFFQHKAYNFTVLVRKLNISQCGMEDVVLHKFPLVLFQGDIQPLAIDLFTPGYAGQ